MYDRKEILMNIMPELVKSNYNFGIDCRDVKIAQMEITSTHDWSDVYDDMPIKMSEYKDSIYYDFYGDDIGKERHSHNTGQVLRTLCPNAKIYLLPSINDGFKWANENNIDIISVSLSGTYATDETELKFEDKIFNLISSGNNGLDKMGDDAKKKHWTSIGAVHLDDKSIIIPSYSATGEELDFTSFSHLKLSDGLYHNGTSFSCPFSAGMIAQYIQLHYNYFGYRPTPQKINDFLLKNAVDLNSLGFDNETGNGLITLPQLQNYKTKLYYAYGEMAIWDNYILKYYPDGISKSKTIRRKILDKQLENYMIRYNIKQVRT